MKTFGLLSLFLALVVGALCFVWHGFSTLQVESVLVGFGHAESGSPPARPHAPAAARLNDSSRSNDPYKTDMDRARAAANAMQRNRQDADRARQ